MHARPLALTAAIVTGSLALAGQAAGQADRSQDLGAFDRQFLQVDRSFSDEARTEAMERFEALKRRANEMSDAEFELAIAEISALADNGHTGVLVGRWAAAFNRLGVRFLIADDGLFVADAVPEYEDLVGSKVVTLAGQDLDALRNVWARYYRGRAGRRDDAMYAFVESPEILHAAGLSSSPESVELVFEGGRTVEVGVTDAWPEPQGMWRWISQAREIELAEAGRVAGNPLYLQDPDTTFRYGELPVDGVAYVQFRANHLFDGGNLKAQSALALKALREASPRAMIVDQRFNFGGNLNDTRDFMQAIPEVVGPDGRVFVIVSGRTFSAGISSVGYLKQAGGDRVTIIGAPVGDPLEFWAEGSPMRLPDTGILIGVATERHNYQTGCPEDDCHGSIRLNPIAVESLEPDVQPEVTYADVVEGRDPYLEAALKLVDEG
ncbi:MAG: hypothetical protein WBN79_13705 [Gemmatimonadota bacterium]